MSKDIPDNISYHPTHPLGGNPDELKEKFMSACTDISSFYLAMHQKVKGIHVDDYDLNINRFYKTVQEMRDSFVSLKLILKHEGNDIPNSIHERYEASEKLIADISMVEPQ